LQLSFLPTGQKHLHHLPLSMRIAASALILVALGGLTLLFIEEAHLREVYFGQRRAHLEEAYRTNELRLVQAFDTLRRDVRFLATTPPVSGIIRAALNNDYDARDGNTRQQWEERLQQIFPPFLLAHPEYYQIACIESAGNGREIIRLLSRDGRVEAVSSGQFQSETDRDYYAATLQLSSGQVRFSEIGLFREGDQSGQPNIQAAVPVFDSDGRVFGLMLLGMRLQPLLQAVATNLPSGVSTYIADRHGRYLFAPDGRRAALADEAGIGHDFPALAAMFEPHPPDFLPLRKGAGKSDVPWLTAGRVHYDPDQPDRFLLLSYAVSDEMAWRFTAIPRRHILIGFTMLFLVCAMVLFLLRRTFAPLRQLTAVASAITSDPGKVVCLPAGSGGKSAVSPSPSATC